MTVAAEALTAADRVEIFDLCARYGMHFDAGDGEACAALFAPGGAFVGPSGAVSGQEPIAAMVAARHEQMPELRHFPTCPALDASEGGARASSYVFALRLDEEPSIRLLTIGRYDDEFERLAEGWRFSTRKYTPWVGAELSDRTVLTGD